MRNDKVRLAVMVLLLCLATAGAALAVRPWVFRWEKDIENAPDGSADILISSRMEDLWPTI